MLGSLEAWRDGQRLVLGGQRQRSVLACLLLEPGREVSTDRIVDAIWGERPPSGVLTTLQTYVFRLREVLEPNRARGTAATVLVTAPGGYRLDTTGVTVDAIQFSQLIADGRAALATDPALTADLLSRALTLWRGDVLSDLPALSTVAPVADRLEQLRLSASESWVEAELAQGHHEHVLATLDDLVGRYPLREHLAAQRMLALYRAGRQADALEAYRDLRRTLDTVGGQVGELDRPGAEAVCADPGRGAGLANDRSRGSRVRREAITDQTSGGSSSKFDGR
jgi:DNA-binding SARP family transcriptional activator